MSSLVRARRQRAEIQPELSLLRPASDPVTSDAPQAFAPSIGHSLGAIAIQRCGPVPCNCADDERATYEHKHAGPNEQARANGSAAGHMAAYIQRAPDDSGGGATNLGGDPLVGDQANGADPLNAGTSGSTTVNPPTTTYNTYSAPTLAALDAILPSDEVGALDFAVSVSSSGDPITSARLDVTQVMTMPRWTEYSSQCQPVKQAWDRFYAALLNHENGHVTRDNQQFAGKHTRFVGHVQSDTQTVTDQVKAEVQAVQDAYDTATDHGRTQTPPTVLDTSPTCGASGARSDLGASDQGNETVPGGNTTTDTTQTMQASRADGSDVRLQGDEIASSLQAIVGTGGGQPLDDATRTFMEPRFGHDFGRVRVHTGDVAAQSASSARSLAFTVGSDIVFGAGQYAPQTESGRHLLAHELTHVVQQSSGPVAGTTIGHGVTISDPSDSYEQAAETNARAIMSGQQALSSAPAATKQTQSQVQRWTNPLVTLKSDAELIEDGADGDLQAIKKITDFSAATDDQKISMIKTLLDQFWVGPRDESALERIWKSFGDRVFTIASAHVDLWTQSADRGAELLDEVPLAHLKAIEFPDDVKEVVSTYLQRNHDLARSQMEHLFTPEEITALQMEMIGIPSAQPSGTQAAPDQHAGYMQKLQVAAASVAKLQKAQEEAQKIDVGYESVTDAAGDAVVTTWLPVQFDPYKPPQFDSKPEFSTFAKTFGNQAVVDAQITPYHDVKEKYDRATDAIASWQTRYPELYAISRERQSDVTAAFASKSPEQARKQLGWAMLSLLGDIAKTQDMLTSGDIDPLDMTPIHDQLLHNQLIGNVSGMSGTNWADPIPAWVAHELVGDHNFWKVLKRLALDTIAAAGYLLAPFTDGASLLVSLAVAGYEASESQSNYESMAQASRTGVVPGTEPFNQGQVDDAKLQADSDEIALVLAAASVGMAAAGEALAGIRGPAGEVPPGELPPGEIPPVRAGGGPGNAPNNMRVTWQNLAEWEQLELEGSGGRVPRAAREGGHVLEKHIYITDEGLQARAPTTGERVATTFSDPDIAVRAINDTIEQNAPQIQARIAASPLGECDAFSVEATFGNDIGHGYRAMPDGTLVRLDGLRTVQVWVQADGTGGWLVRTAFPIPAAAP
jgi:uncharacterized protein DUF4157/CDI toxin RNase A-like protein/uncharacterized protein DUF922